MEHYAGLAVLLELTSVCVVDAQGQIVREAKVPSEPAALVRFFTELKRPVTRIALEAGPLSPWLHAGLTAAGFETVRLETRHGKAALSAMPVKTGGMHAGSPSCCGGAGSGPCTPRQQPRRKCARCLLPARWCRRRSSTSKVASAAILRGCGLKLGAVSKGRFEVRGRELIAGPAILATAIGAMLRARTALQAEFARLHRAMLVIVRADPVCRHLMSVPGVGAVVAVTFKSGVDDPPRFKRSREGGAHFGLTPKTHQSGETDVTGGITRVGDAMGRTAL